MMISLNLTFIKTSKKLVQGDVCIVFVKKLFALQISFLITDTIQLNTNTDTLK